MQDDQKSEVVHKLAMSVQTSYDKFKDKVLDGKSTGKGIHFIQLNYVQSGPFYTCTIT